MTIIRAPIIQDGSYNLILRPAGFLWTGKKFYVGYAWLSSLHPGEEPVWDNRPIVGDGVRIESMPGIHYMVERQTLKHKRKSVTYCILSRDVNIIPNEYCDPDSGMYDANAPRLRYTERMVMPPGTKITQWWGTFTNMTAIGSDEIKKIVDGARSFSAARMRGGKLRAELSQVGGWGERQRRSPL